VNNQQNIILSIITNNKTGRTNSNTDGEELVG